MVFAEGDADGLQDADGVQTEFGETVAAGRMQDFHAGAFVRGEFQLVDNFIPEKLHSIFLYV